LYQKLLKLDNYC